MAITLGRGTVVNADSTNPADVRIDGDRIVAIGKDVRQAGDTFVDAAGCVLFPGGIDPHTHFDLEVAGTRTADDFASGTRAAALGGTTTVLDFATQSRGESLEHALGNWHSKADGCSYVDYGFHLAISDLSPVVLRELEKLKDAGVSSLKLYLAYKSSMQVDDGTVLRVMQIAKRAGLLVAMHCENGDVIDVLVKQAIADGQKSLKSHPATRPIVAEREATERAIALAEIAGTSLYVVHVSSAAALQVIAEARARGLSVFAETCPQYLLLDESVYEGANFSAAKYVISPPLRPAGNQAALWAGLANGTVATIGSDHCSFNQKQKEIGREDFSKIPNGAPGVEDRFGLLYTYGVAAGKISLNQFVALSSSNAAKLFGLYPRKGVIAVGSDADVVVWDPTVRRTISATTHLQRVDLNPYEGMNQTGQARHVLLRGQQIVADSRFIGDRTGIYLRRKPYFPQAGGCSCFASN